ncbi:UDP-glucose 4-epimerase family protein [Marinobacter sp. F4218]|uniref:UDP-glucose 4-epimerase family protein n=1 Tax=Marinobacter sp. F4218 TaxID=2862868 RepID=UPI001C632F27|nr:SDR family oxidoreductase [Marinobacter sp. F4218]MBW7470478.1 SDR family oxidoreductase [Marinobacter sp. F4218]
MSDPSILITGGSGFIGRALARRLVDSGRHRVRASCRSGRPAPVSHEIVESPDLSQEANWRRALDGVDAVIHTAGRAHEVRSSTTNQLAEYRQVNALGTLALARQAAESGVRRFVFLSTVKVNGEFSIPGQPFKPSDTPAPTDPYGISKFEAEEGLRDLASRTDMEVVIIRPVLVYGPGVQANFRSMMLWLKRGFPLPLGGIRNKRSILFVDNLVDLVTVCLDHPDAAGRIFLVSDGEDLSTPQMLRKLGSALGKPARLIPVPEGVLIQTMALLGRGAMANRLCSSLQVDISDTAKVLGWRPPVNLDDALQTTSSDFLAHL